MFGRTLRRATAVALATGALWAPAASGQTGGPVLVVTNDKFSDYYAEILRSEGLNEFAVANVGSLSAGLLSAYQVVVLAPASLNGGQVGALSNWVNGGGNLIAMRPGNELAPLAGLGGDAGDVANGYIQINTTSGPGAGLTNQPVQYHDVADIRGLAGAQQVASLQGGASTGAVGAAVTLQSVGAAGGQVAAFTYDLARSVIYTRQGNPAWVGRAAATPRRSHDFFEGRGQPDWVNLDKVAVPQADEQQRLLANLVTQMNMDRTPLPRFWYLPHGYKAAVVMTGDDHNGQGTAGQFEGFKNASPPGCSVADWQCIRSTSYLWTTTGLSNAAGYEQQGFEVALHLNAAYPNTNAASCADYTSLAQLNGMWDTQLAAFVGNPDYQGVRRPRTNRNHCITWSDWASNPRAELAHGVRLDTNYYYFPESWIGNRPGLFTGAGFPQRFADLDGSLIDVYQATTQLTDESGQDLDVHIRALIDGALGGNGYYGVFTANMHTDSSSHPGADAIVAEAKFRGVPVVSAAQMLDWLDGRNGSSFQTVSYSNQRLRFTVAAAGGSRGLQGMVPAATAAGPLSGLSRDGVGVVGSPQRVKGMDYVRFPAAGGNYIATYGDPMPDTAITGVSVSGTTARLTFVSDAAGATFQCRMDGGSFTACSTPREDRGLSNGTHTFRVRAIDPTGKVDPTPAERAFVVGTLVHKGPKVKITPKRVRITKNGTVRLRVRCPNTESKCRVNLKLKARRKIVAARTFLVKGGKSRVIELTLTRSARASLAGKRTLRVTAVAVSRNAGQRAVTRKTIRLVGR
jgi:hypothetical protein